MQWETGIRLWRWGNAVSCFGVTPYDLYFAAHHTALFFWIVSLLATVILHSWALFSSEECP